MQHLFTIKTIQNNEIIIRQSYTQTETAMCQQTPSTQMQLCYHWQSNLFCDDDTCSSVSDVTTSSIGRLPQDVDGRSSVESALAMSIN